MDLKTKGCIVSSVVVLVRNVTRCKSNYLLLRKRRPFRFVLTMGKLRLVSISTRTAHGEVPNSIVVLSTERE